MPGRGFRLGAEFFVAVGDPALMGSADQLAAWAVRCNPLSRACYQCKRDQGNALICDNRTWQPQSPPISEPSFIRRWSARLAVQRGAGRDAGAGSDEQDAGAGWEPVRSPVQCRCQ